MNKTAAPAVDVNALIEAEKAAKTDKGAKVRSQRARKAAKTRKKNAVVKFTIVGTGDLAEAQNEALAQMKTMFDELVAASPKAEKPLTNRFRAAQDRLKELTDPSQVERWMAGTVGSFNAAVAKAS